MTSVFFAHNAPVTPAQGVLVGTIERWLASRGIECLAVRSVGPSGEPPIQQVRRLIERSDAVLALALPRRVLDTPDGRIALTTPWVHMEVAMALQCRKPVHLLKDAAIAVEGAFDAAATGVQAFELPPGITAPELEFVLEGLGLPVDPRTPRDQPGDFAGARLE